MGIFRRRNEEEAIALSDDSLLAAEAAAATAQNGEAEAAQADADEPAAEPETGPAPACGADAAAREEAWQQAVREATRHWPRLCDEPRQLIAKMAEISARYGDAALWQRAPAGILREAAIELFGLPSTPEAGALGAAVRQAHAEGMRLAAERSQAKLGLAPPSGAKRPPSALSEEERIIRDMAAARRGGIF